jgi:hypothetical protein
MNDGFNMMIAREQLLQQNKRFVLGASDFLC